MKPSEEDFHAIDDYVVRVSDTNIALFQPYENTFANAGRDVLRHGGTLTDAIAAVDAKVQRLLAKGNPKMNEMDDEE